MFTSLGLFRLGRIFQYSSNKYWYSTRCGAFLGDSSPGSGVGIFGIPPMYKIKQLSNAGDCVWFVCVCSFGGYAEEDTEASLYAAQNCVVIETPQRLPERDKFMGQQKVSLKICYIICKVVRSESILSETWRDYGPDSVIEYTFREVSIGKIVNYKIYYHIIKLSLRWQILKFNFLPIGHSRKRNCFQTRGRKLFREDLSILRGFLKFP